MKNRRSSVFGILLVLACTSLARAANEPKPVCANAAVAAAIQKSVADLASQGLVTYSTQVRAVEALLAEAVSVNLIRVELMTSAGFPADDEAYEVKLDSQCRVKEILKVDEL